jgi:hypothetical protein
MPRVRRHSDKLPAGFTELVRLLPPQAIHDEALTILFEAYEKEKQRIDTGGLSPLETLRFLLESNDMSGSDLGRLLGSRQLGPKILGGTRQLSKAHIRPCRSETEEVMGSNDRRRSPSFADIKDLPYPYTGLCVPEGRVFGVSSRIQFIRRNASWMRTRSRDFAGGGGVHFHSRDVAGAHGGTEFPQL